MRPDGASLGGAAAVFALGVLVLLDGLGAMNLRFVVLVPVALAAAGVALVGAVAAPFRRGGGAATPVPARAAPAPVVGTPQGAARPPRERIVGGVAARRGASTPLPVLVWRLAFVALTLVGGVGLVLYLGLWLLAPDGRPELGDRATAQLVAGATLLALAGLAAARSLGLPLSVPVVWPLVLLSAGAVLLTSTSATPGAPGGSTGSRTTVGAALVAGAALVFLVSTGALAAARDVALGAVAVAVVLAAIFAPYGLRLARSLGAERAARIRSQERAELAAHLHDSVLQTLALVQRRAHDPAEVAALARRQERELRAWLAGRATRPGERPSLAAALEEAAGEVEAAHGVPVEVVAVGERAVGEREEALVAAAREAMLNAAKFAGDAGPVAVFADATEEDAGVRVFVRDRGPGFDLATVAPDRRGVRESIVGRMARHGGRAVVGPAPGGGTEVELILP